MKNFDFKNKSVLVMGLGLHGGGVESARFAAKQGARVTCTGLRDESVLAESIEALKDWDIHYVLGRHELEDFDQADIIIKNPAVEKDNPYLCGRDNVETDISLFLSFNSSPVIAVTGSKGKSTVVSALFEILKKEYPQCRLGGNISISPLSFVHQTRADSPVILELSSWQLADLTSRGLLKPEICCITNLLKDHQNRYAHFSDYEADKAVIFENATQDDWCLFPDSALGCKWAGQSAGRTVLIACPYDAYPHAPVSAWYNPHGKGFFREDGIIEEIVPKHLNVPGEPFRLNLCFAAVMARLRGCSAALIRDTLREFKGIPYRMEKFLEHQGVDFIDDTAATIPEASAHAIQAFQKPTILIAGGADKNLDFSPFDSCAQIPKTIIMLSGTATEGWLPRLKELGAAVEGPFESMESAVLRAIEISECGDAILLSPGAASFGMFRHEFHRGDVFKSLCRKLALTTLTV